ncbi:MAG TPA: hypothetical protein VJP80_06325 [Candidatus Saccharimonadales bacterium]|nr:hypothetical protein [Candidatus Saccharimonadales bacterium]
MSFISIITQRLRRPTKKELVVGAVFALAMAGSVALGLSVRGHGVALTTVRDCKHNSIDYKDLNGGCGAYSPSEYIKDVRQNDPTDLQVIDQYFSSDFNLSPSQYDDFAAHAVDGIAYKDGRITTMDGTVVATSGWSIGRDQKSYAWKYTIPHDNTYYWASHSQDVFLVDAIPVMLYFNNQGEVQFIVQKPCGNIMGGTKVHNSLTCQALNASQSKDNPNSYTFTTTASVSGNAKISRVVYHFSDTNTDITTTSVSAPVNHTFAKSGDVTVTVYASVPGGHELASSIVNCQKHITYTPPMYVCTALVANAIDDKTFRFTIKTAQDSFTTVKNADFILDNSSTTSGVDTKDQDGNIYKEYTLNDANSHTVKVTVYFNTLEGVKTDSGHCSATVKPKEQPKCTVPGHEGEAPNSPTCGYCQPGIPIGSPQCTPTTPTPPTTPTALVNTGPGSVIGMFVGTSIAAFFAHKFYVSRRARRAAAETVQIS